MINPNSKVLSVDITHDRLDDDVKGNPHIEFLEMSSSDPRVAARIEELRAQYPGPVFAILDSDHRAFHVLAEMELLRPVLKRGDYVIVEDSNLNGHPVKPTHGPGPFEATEEYFAKYPRDYIRDTERENKFGFTFSTNGFLIRQ
jgi:cephalosporin hydroxylase